MPVLYVTGTGGLQTGSKEATKYGYCVGGLFGVWRRSK